MKTLLEPLLFEPICESLTELEAAIQKLQNIIQVQSEIIKKLQENDMVRDIPPAASGVNIALEIRRQQQDIADQIQSEIDLRATDYLKDAEMIAEFIKSDDFTESDRFHLIAGSIHSFFKAKPVGSWSLPDKLRETVALSIGFALLEELEQIAIERAEDKLK